MNVSPLNPLCFSTVPSPVPFSSVAEETCSPPAWNFSPTRLNDSRSVVSVPFFTRLSYLQRFLLLCPFLRVSAKHLVRTSFRASQSFALRSVKCTIRRYKDALMILTSSGTSSSPLERESISRETLSSIKLLPVS